MSKYSEQGAKTRDLGGASAPAQNRGGQKIIDCAKGETVGIVGDKGIGKDGLPLRPYPKKGS